MAYRRLPFEQYFINTSEDFNGTGKSTFRVTYTAVTYCSGSLQKALGLQHEMNYEIHYEPDRDVIQINFQRTLGFSDWFANIAEFSSRYYDAIEFEGQPLQLRVHHGWGNMYRSIKHDIRDQWTALHEAHPDAETEILGWSLGSGLATLCCQDLNYNFGVRPYLYTYGSVRPFRARRSEAGRMHRYLRSVCGDCWNFANINDIVTYMPPFRGFGMIHRVDVGQDEPRTVRRLFNPVRYHTTYDKHELYDAFTEETT